jgi:hypothetical protein
VKAKGTSYNMQHLYVREKGQRIVATRGQEKRSMDMKESSECWRSSKLPYIEGNLHWATVELNAINRTALFTVVAVM